MVTRAGTQYITPDNIDTIFDSMEDPGDQVHKAFKKMIMELQSFVDGNPITLELALDYWNMYIQGWIDCKKAYGIE